LKIKSKAARSCSCYLARTNKLRKRHEIFHSSLLHSNSLLLALGTSRLVHRWLLNPLLHLRGHAECAHCITLRLCHETCTHALHKLLHLSLLLLKLVNLLLLAWLLRHLWVLRRHTARHSLKNGHLIQLLLQLLDGLLLHNQHLLGDHGLLLSTHLLVEVSS